MARAFDLVQQFADVVKVQARPYASEITRFDDESRPRGNRRGFRQTAAQRVVDNVLEGPAGTADASLQFRRDVVVQA